MQSSKKIKKGFIEDYISDSTQAALDLKANNNNVIHKTGNEAKDGNLTLNDTLFLPDFAALPGELNNIGIDETGAVVTVPIESSSTGDVKITATNKTATTIPKGAVVYINGAQGSKATIDLAIADSNVTTSAAIGITSASIPVNGSGYIVIVGEIQNLNTSVFTNGTKVYLSPIVPGGLTDVIPTSPNNVTFIGTVTNAHSSQGKIVVNVLYTTKLDRLVDVAIAAGLDEQVLSLEASSGLWKNRYINSSDILGALGYIPESESNKQNSLVFDGTGEKYPTVDTVNETFLRNTKLVTRTGIGDKTDQFELIALNTTTVRIKPVDLMVFWDELFVTNAVSDDAYKSFPQLDYPLTQLVTATGGNININPITTDGIYARYIGYNKLGKVVSSTASFIENSTIAQLGLVTVIKAGAVVTFLGGNTPGARNVFSIPILALTNDLQRLSTVPKTNVTIEYNVGTPSLKTNPGSITGLSINWRGVANPSNSSPIDKFNYLGDAVADFISISPLFLTMSTAPTFHTLWTETEDSIAINNSFFNTTTQLRGTLNTGKFALKRVLIGLRGGIFIQESEHATADAYATMADAQANMFTHDFTEAIIPPDIVIEIARIAFKKGVTDFSDPAQYHIASATTSSGGGGGSVSEVSDATTASKGIVQLSGDLSGTATAPTVPALAGKEILTSKQNSLATDGTGTKYPTVDAVNAGIVSAATPDATTSVKGKIKLAGDLAGTADSPSVVGLAGKEVASNKTDIVATNEGSSSLYASLKGLTDYLKSSSFYTLFTVKSTIDPGDYVWIWDSAASFLPKKVLRSVIASSSETLQNKNIEPRVQTNSYTGTETLTVGTKDNLECLNITNNVTFDVFGTPLNRKGYIFFYKANGVYTITWNPTMFDFTSNSSIVKPVSTVANKLHMSAFRYDSASGKFINEYND